ncbi:MAG: polysaccharide deacetylase family protein, partial [Bacteroidales bacterium]|nr:polysaccharide deacetylase family protein [Bacteroidales bacterium]
CALTFDDSPDPIYTPAILTILKQENLSATFFVIGEKLAGNESLVAEIETAGHLIGNHSWSHSVWFDFFPAKKMQQELSRTASALSEIIGKSPLLFRPPFGVINPALSKAVTRLAYHVIGWNVRSYDTMHQDPQKTISRILRKVSPGSVILLHDHLSSSPQILEELIEGLKRKGYAIVPLTQLISIEAYA